jgi:2-polyprenyl-3-methyl-5-hydroxy-6-metoxy-1,4-benzoquinol methylase
MNEMEEKQNLVWIDYFMSCLKNNHAVNFFLESTTSSVTKAIMRLHPEKEELSYTLVANKVQKMLKSIIHRTSAISNKTGRLINKPYDALHEIRDEVLFPEFLTTLDIFIKEDLEYRINFISPYIKGNSVLDIGCGSGIVLKHLQMKRHDLELHGIDPYIQTTSKGDINFSKINLLNPNTLSPFKGDTVLLFHVLHHIGDNDKTLLDFLERVRDSCEERLLIIEDTFIEECSRNRIFNKEFGFTENSSFHKFIEMDRKTQKAVLAIIDVVVNVGMFGLNHMPFPFHYKSIFEWEKLFNLNGWKTTFILPIKTFAPEVFFHGPYMFFVLDKCQ